MKKNFRMMLLGLLAMSSMSAFADIDENARSVNDVLYQLVTNGDGSKTATVVGVNASAQAANVTNITIPAEVKGEHGDVYKVVFINSNWANAGGNKDVTNIVESLSIDAANFANYDLSNSFSSLKKLKNLTIKENKDGKALTYFPYFYDHSIVETVDIEESVNVTYVPEGKFSAGKLKSIKLPSSVTEIGKNAFNGCKDLTSFVFGEKLETIGQYAFAGSGVTAADLSKTKLTEVTTGVFEKSKVASVSFPKTLTMLNYNAFNEAPLATITYAEPNALKKVKPYALAYTDLTEFTIVGGDYGNKAVISYYAFEGCNMLKKVDFVGANFEFCQDDIDEDAFPGCILTPTIYAPQDFIDTYETLAGHSVDVPNYAKWEPKAAPVKDTEEITTKSGWVKWFDNTKQIAFDAEKYKVFSVYVDNGDKKKDGTAYFVGLKRIDGRYYVDKGEHVIIKAVDGKVTYEDVKYGWKGSSVLKDEIFTFVNPEVKLGEFQKYYYAGFSSETDDPTDMTSASVWYIPGQYLYRMVVKDGGVGFSLFTGKTMKGGFDATCGDAQFFIQSLQDPTKTGRLNCIWIDEDGNVIEGSTTGINEIETAANENGAAYNLAGQKVNASYKGVVIQNGKKVLK